MATVYKVEIVSDWTSYDEDAMKRLIQEGIPDKGNIRVTEVIRK